MPSLSRSERERASFCEELIRTRNVPGWFVDNINNFSASARAISPKYHLVIIITIIIITNTNKPHVVLSGKKNNKLKQQLNKYMQIAQITYIKVNCRVH